MKRAYSYVRFSTAEQLKGKSLERQTEAANAWCKQHNVELDNDLTLHDLGVSAFRGKNADIGALGSFLKAVHVGQVPKGSYLLIEAFDRMSRESAYDAQLTLQNIINAGITVVTLLDGKEYNVAILRADPIALIYAILLMSRSHEESATKSKRVADAWRRRRAALAPGKVITACTPGWIELDGHRKPKIVPERGEVVRRIFADLLAGDGYTSIAANLNRERVRTFGGGRWWTPTYVRNVLRNRAVLGEFQPCQVEHSAKGTRRVPVGDPIKNYWPSVIDPKTFKKAQDILKHTKRRPRAKGLRNILAGVAFCAACGGMMQRTVGDGRSGPRLVCAAARAGVGCSFRSARLALVETALSTKAPKLFVDVPDKGAELQQELEGYRSELVIVQRRISDLAMLLSETPTRTIAARIQQDEVEVARLQSEIARVQAQMQYGGVRRMRDAVARMKSALQWHATDPSDVAGVNAALRECFEKVVVNVRERQLEMHWRHGPVSTVSYIDA